MVRIPTPKTGAPRLLALGAFALALTALAFAAPTAKPTTSPHGIIINHEFKVKELGLTCDTCHSPSTTNGALMAFPTMDTCATCHADETDMSKGSDKCSMCHTNADYSSTVRKDKVILPDIKFSHVPHAAAKVECLSCHTVFNKNGVTGNEMLPTMNTCITCHTAKKVPNGTDCATCHVSDVGNQKPASHTALWLQNHGKGLSQTTIQGTCNSCHTVQSGNDCNSCHQREAPPSHNAGWTLGAHGQAARANPQSCNTCHTQQQCLDCHTEQKPWTHTGNWGNTGGPGEDLHCVTCHVVSGSYYAPTAVSSNCFTCHSTSGISIKHSEAPHRAANHNTSTTCSTACHNPSTTPPKQVLHPIGMSYSDCASCHPHD